MVARVIGPALQAFVGNAQPQHTIPGPGPDAFKLIGGADRMTYLVSPGVYDCAILTVFLPARPVNVANRPMPTVVMGRHRAAGARAMAHYNNFNGPKLAGLKTLFDSILRSHAAAANDLVVSISHHTGARGGYYNTLADLVGQAVPGLASLTIHSYGAVVQQQRGLQPVTIYLAPDGQIRGSQ